MTVAFTPNSAYPHNIYPTMFTNLFYLTLTLLTLNERIRLQGTPPSIWRECDNEHGSNLRGLHPSNHKDLVVPKSNGQYQTTHSSSKPLNNKVFIHCTFTALLIQLPSSSSAYVFICSTPFIRIYLHPHNAFICIRFHPHNALPDLQVLSNHLTIPIV